MTDYLAATPVVIPSACPGCERGRDTTTYVVNYCALHTERPEGTADHLVTNQAPVSVGGTEAGVEDNRAWCALLHRRGR
jgi:hypothetical protein